MLTINNVHEQFASFFSGAKLKPFANLVSKQLSEGHICLNLDEIISGETEFPINYQRLEDIEKDLLAEKLVGTSFEDHQPFILHNSRFYIQRYFAYETLILKRIERFLEKEVAVVTDRMKQLEAHRDLVVGLFNDQESVSHLPVDEQIDWQCVASVLALLNDFTIITGGPGTGKTTTTNKLLKILKSINPDLKVGLAAPTGKAAARLAESLDEGEATTIHRLLKTISNTHHFQFNEQNPLQYDVVIIDEASMVDVALFSKLLGAIGDETRLILLGDKDQLASVEAGSLFRDLCLTQKRPNQITGKVANFVNSLIQNPDRALPESYSKNIEETLLTNHIVELKRSRRFDSKKGIGKFSKAIINNEVDVITYFVDRRKTEQIHIDINYSDRVFSEFINRYRDFITEPDVKIALHKFNQLRVLCAIREGEQGLYHVNKRIEDILTHANLIHPKQEFYYNRPIIVTQNYYDLNLYNGDIGIIRYNEDQQPVAYFEDGNGLKEIAPGLIGRAETVFAMTIHKSQGSEYKGVLIILPPKEDLALLTRELLYTAITRAKEEVIIQVNEGTLFSTAKRQVKRASGISERLIQ